MLDLQQANQCAACHMPFNHSFERLPVIFSTS